METTMNYAIIKNEIVINVIVADQGFADGIAASMGAIAMQSGTAGVGHTYVNGVFTPPTPPAPASSKQITRFSKLAFLGMMTDAEFAGILAAAKQSAAIEAWLYKFNAASVDVDGTSIDLADPRTIAGITALQGAGLISEETRTNIFTPQY